MNLKSRLEKLEKGKNRIDRATIIREARLKVAQELDKKWREQQAQQLDHE